MSVTSTCSGRFGVSKSSDNNRVLDAKVSRECFAAFRHLAWYGVSIRPWIDKHSGELCGEIGQNGGQPRAKSLTASERKRIAIKASKAAARARTAQARAKAKKNLEIQLSTI